MADAVEVPKTTAAPDGTANAQKTITITEASRAEIVRLLERVVEAMSSFGEFSLEVFKARQLFYERLMLLNAGTLTLFFTVIGALASTHNSQMHIRDGYHLLYGCWLLILAIVLCLLHNWINISTMIHGSMARICAKLGIEMNRLEQEMKRCGDSMISLASLESLRSQGDKAHKSTTRSENICRVIGPSAQILTICAYFQFILSFRATVMTLLN